MRLNPKQSKALLYLQDNTTTELLYGGGAGGGKSILGCYWLIKSCLKYPGTRWVMGRSEMKTLRETTFQSFLKVCAMQKVKPGLHYRITSSQDKENPNAIVFNNGSVILMKDLKFYPQDPDFDELGSLEITGAFIDEANQIVEKAKAIVGSRIRHDLSKYGLIPKILMTCNPAKNWTYQSFYKPYKDGSLLPYRKFIQALVGDNPDIDKNYEENLRKLDEISKQRLYYGNWEYDDDPASLMSYDKIIDCFSNSFIPPGERFITGDIARFGKDKTVIGVWTGWNVALHEFSKKSTTDISDIIRKFQLQYKVPNSNTIVDEDGVGGGVVDTLRCKGFVNNSAALAPMSAPKDKNGNPIKENYKNLKSQCYYRLADRINASGLHINCPDITMREMIIEELEQVKQHEMDKDGKKAVVPKEDVKQIIGRSPDYSDTLMMREWFELVPKNTGFKIGNAREASPLDWA